MLGLLRLGQVKFNPAIYGVIVVDVALVYDPLSIAFCHEVMVGVLVVSEHVGGVFAMTCKTQVHEAFDWLLLTDILNT